MYERLHLDGESRSSFLETKGVFTSFYLLRNSMGGLDPSLRGRGVGRKRKHGPIFPNSTAFLYVPWWLLFLLPPLIQVLPFCCPHGTNMPVAGGS